MGPVIFHGVRSQCSVAIVRYSCDSLSITVNIGCRKHHELWCCKVLIVFISRRTFLTRENRQNYTKNGQTEINERDILLHGCRGGYVCKARLANIVTKMAAINRRLVQLSEAARRLVTLCSRQN
ncbi:hypothetical protein J6590_017717 [Homalodisca vitripennis]|nr:hypothetical protein J6590_017717 [Homalodisca vitripennis]